MGQVCQPGELRLVADPAQKLLEHDAWNGDRHIVANELGQGVCRPKLARRTAPAAERRGQHGRVQ